ncbi:MAG: hypothetical protein ACKO2P_21675 [Planctomycetota bacterium]
MNNLSSFLGFMSSIVSAVTLVVLVNQLRLLRRQISDDHERSRREKALQLLAKWTDFVSEPGGTAPANFTQMLSSDQTESLVHSKEFTISEKLKDYIEIWLENVGTTDKLKRQEGTDLYVVPRRISALIRRRVAAYLNNLEVIMEAKRHMIADPRILHEQFCGYVNPAKNKDMLQKFRKATAGDGGFPGIEAFMQSVSDGTHHQASSPLGKTA